jgi:MoaA/NifB/PqqE/SkfB family radical SAM enzyme
MGARKLVFELERIYSEDIIAQTAAETGLERCDIPVSSKGRMREYSPETLQDRLFECQDRGRKAGIYVTFEPPFLTDDIEACYGGHRRTKERHICKGFRMATIAPDGSLINCYAIRKPFGNILDAPFDDIWNSGTANNFRKKLVRNNLTPLCENCLFMVPYGEAGFDFNGL